MNRPPAWKVWCIVTVIRTVELLAQAGTPAALIALGVNLSRFEVKGDMRGVVMISASKLLAMPAVPFAMAKLLNLPRS